jgi:hypothetical protein
MPHIKLTKEVKNGEEKYCIIKDDWTMELVVIYTDDSPKVKEEKILKALNFYKQTKEDILNPTLIETILEETI